MKAITLTVLALAVALAYASSSSSSSSSSSTSDQLSELDERVLRIEGQSLSGMVSRNVEIWSGVLWIKGETHITAGYWLKLHPGVTVKFAPYEQDVIPPCTIPWSVLIIDSGAKIWAENVEFVGISGHTNLVGGLYIAGTAVTWTSPRYASLASTTAATPMMSMLKGITLTGLGNGRVELDSLGLIGVGALDIAEINDLHLSLAGGDGVVGYHATATIRNLNILGYTSDGLDVALSGTITLVGELAIKSLGECNRGAFEVTDLAEIHIPAQDSGFIVDIGGIWADKKVTYTASNTIGSTVLDGTLTNQNVCIRTRATNDIFMKAGV